MNSSSQFDVDNKISLSLSDLMADSDINTSVEGYSGKAAIDYRKELTKLLSKSKGTPYEATLRRFIETKLRDMNNEDVERPGIVTAGLASLNISKYDSPNRQSPFDNNPLFKTKDESWLEVMSQPNPRHVWKVTYATIIAV